MNNNIIPACIIGAGLFAVALKPAPQPAPIPQAEPVAVATASITGASEPVIVWYGIAGGSFENSTDVEISCLEVTGRVWHVHHDGFHPTKT